MTIHGFFSQKQKQKNGKSYIYLNMEGIEVEVSEVNREKPKDIYKNFNDNVYVGEVNKFVRQITSLNMKSFGYTN